MPKRVFDHCVDDYVRYRPGYPPEVFAQLVGTCPPERCRWAVDMGAGTGIFARLLAERGYRALAVEPSEAMLRKVRGPVSGGPARISLVCSSAERTALSDGGVDLVTCAQSFHWFNPPAALAEFGRILSPGGRLWLVWNNRDRERGKFVARFEALVRRYNPAYDVEYRQQDWAGKIRQSGLFDQVDYQRFEWVWERNAEELVGFTRSVSYIRNVVGREQVPRFESELRALVKRCAEGGRCPVSMRTECWSAVRQPGA